MSQGALLTPGPSIHQRPMATGKGLPRGGPQGNGGGSSNSRTGTLGIHQGTKEEPP